MSKPLVQVVDGAFCYRAGFAIDADGCPRAYHPDGKSGLDYLANAGREGNWWGLACNDMGVPLVQTHLDPYPGFFISTTSLVDKSKKRGDPARYVDSEQVPYITTTRDMMKHGARVGDIGVVTYGGASCCVIVADVGPHPGEGSIALARELGIPSNPRNGGLSAPAASYCVFKDSARPWPRKLADISQEALLRLEQWGGHAKLASVLAA